MTRKEELLDYINGARDWGRGLALVVTNPTLEYPEVIINRVENLSAKADYIREAYSDDLTLKSNEEVKIESWYWE